MNVRAVIAFVKRAAVGVFFLGILSLFYLTCNRLPMDPFEIPIGTTSQAVTAKLGPPQEKTVHEDGSEVWYYHGDLLNIAIYSLKFDAEGRLEHSWW